MTSGTFTLDGGTWDVPNNVWLLGDQNDVLVIDAAHDADAIMAAVDGRPVVGILCSHGHNDHIDAAPELADRTGAPILLHPADAPLWGMTHATRYPDDDLRDGQVITMDGIEAAVLHTPGIPPARCACRCPRSAWCSPGTPCSPAGRGATGRSFSDFPTIIDSISRRLLTLPAATVVHAGHGDDTTIGAEAPQLDDWVVRGH